MLVCLEVLKCCDAILALHVQVRAMSNEILQGKTSGRVELTRENDLKMQLDERS